MAAQERPRHARRYGVGHDARAQVPDADILTLRRPCFDGRRMDAGELVTLWHDMQLDRAVQHQTQASDRGASSMYTAHIYRVVNESWARANVTDIYHETAREVLSLEGEIPTDTLRRLVEFQRRNERADQDENFCGQRVTINVVPTNQDAPPCYQDGTAVSEDEVTLFHGTRELHGILRHGLHGSIDSHGASGAWAFALESCAYDWGLTALDLCNGCVLHLRCPANEEALHQNRRVKGTGEQFGHCRWVIRGQEGSPVLRCRIIAVSVRLPTPAMLAWRMSLKTAICHSARWVWGYEWRTRSAALPADVDALATQAQKRGRLVSKGKSEALRRVVQPRLEEMEAEVRSMRVRQAHPRAEDIVPLNISNVEKQVFMLVSRRMIYASGSGIERAFSHTAVLPWMQKSGNITKGNLALSADIARAIAGLVIPDTTPSPAARRAYWERASWSRTPEPLRLWLRSTYPCINFQL